MNCKFAASVLTITLLSIAMLTAPEAQARGRGRGNSQAMRMQAQQALALNTQLLAQAEATISEASSTLDAAKSQVSGARETLENSTAAFRESFKSQKTIEAEILTAQGDDSDYGKANMAYLEAQQVMKDEKERVLTSDAYLKEKSALQKGAEAAAKIAKLQHDSLDEDDEYQTAHDKYKGALATYTRIKTDLFKASPEWVAASQALRESHAGDTKANAQATQGAMRSLPARRALRDAEQAAAQARMNIAQAQMMLRSMGRGRGGRGGGGGSY